MSRSALVNQAKKLLQNFLYPVGCKAMIRRGPLKGCTYIVSDQSGWAPILGRWEPEAQNLYCQIVAAGEVVWDLGANTGIHTLLFSKLVGDRGQVVAFEPLKVNAEEILQTCSLNGATNVRVIVKAVSDCSAPAVFFIGHHDKQGSLVGIGSESGDRVHVDCQTLDEALSANAAPDFIKIDIEGAESRALHGFSRLPTSYPSFAIDLHTPAEDVAVGRWLKGHGYRVFRLSDQTARAQLITSAALTPVLDLERGWPEKAGIWGTVVAVHPSRIGKLAVIESMSGAASAIQS